MSVSLSAAGRILFIVATILAPASAFAYVGPGAGITAIGSLLALLAGILLAIVGFLWYPLKRYFRSRSSRKEQESATTQSMTGKSDSPEDN